LRGGNGFHLCKPSAIRDNSEVEQARELTQKHELSTTNERTFTLGEIRGIIGHASIRKEYSDEQNIQRLGKSLVEGITTSTIDSRYSLETLYNAAEQVEIPRKYVEEVLSLRYPTMEQQDLDLRKLGSYPSLKVKQQILKEIEEIYKSEITKKLESQLLPNELQIKKRKSITRMIFGNSFMDLIFNKSTTYFEHNGKVLADLTFSRYPEKFKQHVRFNLYDSLFASMTGDAIEDLKERFKEYNYPSVHHHYFTFSGK